MDMVMDSARQRIYIANSGLNQVEVLDMKTQTLKALIKVGQFPHALALGTEPRCMSPIPGANPSASWT
jgi:YVTN family beta-propeller protein